MKLVPVNRYEIALHDVPTCAVCNKPVERMESMYDVSWRAKRFRVYCHGQKEEAFLNDIDIWNADSIRMGQAFIDTLSQPQLEQNK